MIPPSTTLSGKPNILIYNGHGTSRRLVDETAVSVSQAAPHHTLVRVNKQQLAERGWHRHTALLILPGGRDVRYLEALEGEPNESIRDFVASGGSYLGICAGAYYASDRITFALDQPDIKVEGPRPLKFFRGICHGPVTPKFDYNDFTGSQAWRVWPKGGLAYYHGGGTFMGAGGDPDVEVMHTYDRAGALPATIACRHGEGLAVLTGLHWEFSGLRLSEGYPAAMVSALVGCESTRRAEFARIVRRGLGHSASDGVQQGGGGSAGSLCDGGHVVEIQ